MERRVVLPVHQVRPVVTVERRDRRRRQEVIVLGVVFQAGVVVLRAGDTQNAGRAEQESNSGDAAHVDDDGLGEDDVKCVLRSLRGV
jgi:hypothetical protein